MPRRPMMEWRLTPASQKDLRTIAARVRALGYSKAIRKELVRGLRKGAKPAETNVKQAATNLPASGRSSKRLRERIVRATGLAVRTTRKPGVKVKIAKNKMGDAPSVPRHMNLGRWRHPVFGNTNVWVSQTSQRGWFDKAALKAAPEVRRSLHQVLDDIEKRVNLP